MLERSARPKTDALNHLRSVTIELWVSGLGFRALGFGFRGSGLGLRVSGWSGLSFGAVGFQ